MARQAGSNTRQAFTRGVLAKATAPAAVTWLAIQDYFQMTKDVTSCMNSVSDNAIEHQCMTDPGADDYIEEVVCTPAAAITRLRQCTAKRITIDSDLALPACG